MTWSLPPAVPPDFEPLPPARGCVYRHYAADGRLLYIGESTDPTLRQSHHRRRSPWWPEVARIEVEWFSTYIEARQAEKAAIRAENPEHNRRR